MSITAVIPVWNGRELLGRLLDSLEAQTAPVTELLVVDNGSSDGAPELAARRGARVIPMGRNAGFAAAVNRGIQSAGSAWIAVLNSDVELAPDYLAQLIDSGGWFATGKILSAREPAHIDGTFDLVSRAGAAWRAGSGRMDTPAFSQAQPVWTPPWTAAVFRSELFERVGLLDELFESYLEDVDFGLRCAEHSLAGEYVPTAIAWHQGSAALGRWHPETVRRMARNQVFLLARHYPRHLLWTWLWPILVGQLLWGGVALRHGSVLAWLKGKWEGLRRFSSVRRDAPPCDLGILEPLLLTHERALRDLQSGSGRDLYWRMYFLLTRGGAK
ncbi:MAG: glycosyltransferase family 2 protein [Bryobacteraceae bacterium]